MYLDSFSYSGTFGDPMSSVVDDDLQAVGKAFSTYDREQDTSSTRICTKMFGGAWWFGNCGRSSLNRSPWIWAGLNGNLVDMKIRAI